MHRMALVGSVGKRVFQAYLQWCEFESHQGHMAYLRVGAQVTICENFNKKGRNWKNVTGYILMMTRKEVTVQTEYGQIIVPRKKVVAN
jgi:hypothetical protein